ncbi:MAG: hypothetical protein M1825_003117 [Sarcosagium campestre]|nr:MAG: hypothetical protein M1825_003117 [Sarcosagium campestre]
MDPTHVDSQSDTNATGRSFSVDVSRPPPAKVEDEVDQLAQSMKHCDPVGARADSDTLSAGESKPKNPKKKAKSKNKNKSKTKKPKPSGFEENFADTPLTRAEHAEEVNDLYHRSRPFSEYVFMSEHEATAVTKFIRRIEACIQRYRARRRMDSVRKDIFDKYLALGGINTGPKMFGGGMDQRDLEERDAEEIANMAAIDHVPNDKTSAGQEGSRWVVDFEGIVRCFFSCTVPDHLDITNPEKVKTITNIVTNFLNYVLYHNVCPEYEGQVYAAREICKKAEVELVKIDQVTRLLPGKFNAACSTLYGGFYKDLYSSDHEVMEDDEIVGMSDKEAEVAIKTALAALGTEPQIDMVEKGTKIQVVSKEEIFFEVTEITLPDEETKQFYDGQLLGKFKPLGRMQAKLWANPYAPPVDMSDDEESPESIPKEKVYEFWLEEDILLACFLGMKVQAVVRETNIGIQYFDLATQVNCSFFMNVENELMTGWKEPKALKRGERRQGQGQGQDAGEEEADDGEPTQPPKKMEEWN